MYIGKGQYCVLLKQSSRSELKYKQNLLIECYNYHQQKIISIREETSLHIYIIIAWVITFQQANGPIRRNFRPMGTVRSTQLGALKRIQMANMIARLA